MFNLVWPLIVGYLIGSFPTAYLVVRLRSRKDIRKMGSGNVGTLNSYEVTGSKAVGVTVLIVDLLKGVAAVLVGMGLLVGLPFVGAAFSGTAAVIGHSYPVWLLFRGGRGLATGAGAMGAVCLPVVGVWLALWGIGYAITRAVNAASFIASVVLLGLLLSLPDGVVRSVLPGGATTRGLRAFGVMLLLVILTRLVAPFRDYVRDRRPKRMSERGDVS